MSDPTISVAPQSIEAGSAGQPTVMMEVGQPVQLDVSSRTPDDVTSLDASLSQAQWERLSGQRDVMIKAMVSIFTWLNGGVFALVLLAWVVGIWVPDYRIVDSKTLMTLIGATVVQAGIAFVAITRFLFPGPKDDTNP
ncbi:hypothetical protein [Roseateles sp. LYH14W]|uniref:Phage holin family protein n=1 Tax=Pelomonas parva TaxID=3299032 RepID=A0ABW7F409_9BURK